jgi:hypothetical protein
VMPLESRSQHSPWVRWVDLAVDWTWTRAVLVL